MKKLILLIMFLTAVTLLQAESVTDQATAAYRMGNFQKAADLYELALVQESDNTLIHRMLGSALYKLGRPQEAIEHFEIYLAGNPDPRLQAYVDNAKSQMQAIQQINSTPVTSGSVVPGISKKKAVAWSLIPGMGQIKRGDRIRGWIYMLGTAALAGGALYASGEGDSAYDAYRKSTTLEEAKSKWDNMKSWDDMYAMLGNAAIALYAVNIADAFFFTPVPQVNASTGETSLAYRAGMNYRF